MAEFMGYNKAELTTIIKQYELIKPLLKTDTFKIMKAEQRLVEAITEAERTAARVEAIRDEIQDLKSSSQQSQGEAPTPPS